MTDPGRPGHSGGTVDARLSVSRSVLRLGRELLFVVVAVGLLAVVVAVLQNVVGFDNGAPAFLLAVVVIAVLRGTGPAIATAIGSFLAYDFLFIEPVYTLTVSDPAEWLNLLLLLVVGVVIGQLAGRERGRAVAAIEGEQEARALFSVSFTLASERDMAAALLAITRMLGDETRATRVWIVVGDTVAAESGSVDGPVPTSPAVYSTLRRNPGDDSTDWVRVHAPGRAAKGSQVRPTNAFRVAISASGKALGAIWLVRARDLGDPDEGQKRVLAAAADQIGGSLERERLARDATTAEVARRSDALKSALLDSVSHDLRTPLASIRAAAGTLMDPDIEWPPDQRRDIAGSIDREAEWLNRLVTNLLDMSRIEAGQLRPNLVIMTVGDAVDAALDRTRAGLGDRPLEVDVPPDIPPVLADEVLLGQVLANALDNAAKYAGADTLVRISAHVTEASMIRITIEDAGLGVPAESLPRLFEKFYRVPRKGEGSRRGTGIGLAVVRGIVDAMAGRVEARKSDLGGLAVDVDLPVATAPVDEVVETDGSDATDASDGAVA